ncbi:MAG: hypothetical protein P8X57_10465, partial [Cyclobacteriaceae bacterium]
LLAIAQVVYHYVKVNSLTDLKEKYDYIRENEIRNFQRAFLFLAITIACVINTYGMGSMSFHAIWFFVRVFMGIAGAVLVGYVAQLILQYYYPTPLHKKLHKLRYTPRTNPENGNKMRLLGEHEEDVHLEEGMQAEENIFSVDYDVWVDEETGYTKIEKYPGHLDALQCGNCGFYTLKVEREEIVKAPTSEEDGELIKYYRCEYCDSIRATAFHIVRDASYGPQDFSQSPDGVSLVRVEMISNDGERRIYEFQGIAQAEKFLQEYQPA